MMLSPILQLPLLLGLAISSHQDSKPNFAVLDDLEHRAVNFFWEQSNPKNGFAKDRAVNSDKVDDHTVASSASVGFALTAYVIGAERGWIPREDALNRTRITIQHVFNEWPQQRGWLYHFVDWNTGERMWKSEASTIDTSICLAGVLVAQQYWNDPLTTLYCQKFTNRIDWKYMLTDGGAKPDSKSIVMGWHPEDGFINARWDNWDELKMIYVQAYGATNMGTDGWAEVKRPLVTYKGIDTLAGGPLFMHEMSESFYDFKGLRDSLGYNYWVESKNAALANRQYCIDNPKGFKAYGPDFWGLSASDGPTGYEVNGAPGNASDDGTITPTSAVAAVQFVPDLALSFYTAMRQNHPEAWGRYGFPNGLNPTQAWVGPDVIGIDLGMMMTAVENARTGLVSKLSASNDIVKRGMQRIGFVPGTDDVLRK